MAPSTAASFLILGASLLRLSRKRRLGFAPKAMIAPVILVMMFSLLNVAGNIAGVDLNSEARLTSGAGTIKGIPVSRMSPLTGAAFTLAGLATLLLLLRRKNSRLSRRLGHCASSLGVLTILGGSTVLLAYIYGSPLMYGGTLVPMAATTAIAFVLLGAVGGAAQGLLSHLVSASTVIPNALRGSLMTCDLFFSYIPDPDHEVRRSRYLLFPHIYL